jgi:hypothetical protein
MWEVIVDAVLLMGQVECVDLEPMPNVSEVYTSNFNRRISRDTERKTENPQNLRPFIPCTS